jgi:hypothetical protein
MLHVDEKNVGIVSKYCELLRNINYNLNDLRNVSGLLMQKNQDTWSKEFLRLENELSEYLKENDAGQILSDSNVAPILIGQFYKITSVTTNTGSSYSRDRVSFIHIINLDEKWAYVETISLYPNTIQINFDDSTHTISSDMYSLKALAMYKATGEAAEVSEEEWKELLNMYNKIKEKYADSYRKPGD